MKNKDYKTLYEYAINNDAWKANERIFLRLSLRLLKEVKESLQKHPKIHYVVKDVKISVTHVNKQDWGGMPLDTICLTLTTYSNKEIEVLMNYDYMYIRRGLLNETKHKPNGDDFLRAVKSSEDLIDFCLYPILAPSIPYFIKTRKRKILLDDL